LQSAWNDCDADATVAAYENLGRDLAPRLYTTRPLGGDPRLVLHGGGNTESTWQRKHPRQRRQCRPHPLRTTHRGDDRLALQRAASASRITCAASCLAGKWVPEDVAQAFLAQALAIKTTADVDHGRWR
jgi:hypothetical protein